MKTTLIQLLSNTGISASILFIPNLAADLGASHFFIGAIGAAYGGALFLSSSFFGRAADIYSRVLILRLGLLISAVTFGLQTLAVASPWTSPSLLLTMRFLAGLSAGIIPGALIATVYQVRSNLGNFASWGAVGWTVGNLAAGLIALYYGIFLFSSAAFILAFTISLVVKSEQATKKKTSLFATNVLRENFVVYGAYLLRHAGAHAVWIIFPLFLVGLGADRTWVGILYAVNTVSQIVLMRVADRFRSNTLILAGIVSSAATFLSYSLATNFIQIIPMQILLAWSWSALYLGSLKFLMTKNDAKATAAGLLSSTISLATVIGPLIGGAVTEIWGFKGVMYVAAAMSLASLVFLRVESKAWR